MAVERHRLDLEIGKKRGLHFDSDSAQFAIGCFQFFRHSKGKHAGQQFNLSPWQAFIVWCIFGWKKADGNRRFTRAYIEVARKNGKSTFLAGIALILLALDGEAGAEVYSAATKKDQARIVFNEAKRMVKASPELREFIKAYRNNLNVPETDSKMEPLSADANSLDGLNPHGGVVDELHAHRTREVWDVLDTATGAREQALLIAITTAGFNQEGICFEVRSYGIEVLTRVAEDDAYFFFIAAIDDEDDWQDERNWPKANPNQGISVSLEDLQAKAKRAKRSAGALNNFLIKHLNRWTQQAERWLSIERWDRCTGDFTEESLVGRSCFAGLDLATKVDLNAFCLVFPPVDAGEKWKLIWRFWIPEDTIERRREEGDHKYKTWADQGALKATGEASADWDVICADIVDLGKRFEIVQIGYDPWQAHQMHNHLSAAGFTTVEVKPDYRNLSEASKEFEAMVLSRKLEHRGDTIARWNVDNSAIRSDGKGNIVPQKPKDQRKKMDGVIAAVTALSRALVTPIEPTYNPQVFFL